MNEVPKEGTLHKVLGAANADEKSTPFCSPVSVESHWRSLALSMKYPWVAPSLVPVHSALAECGGDGSYLSPCSYLVPGGPDNFNYDTLLKA